MSAEESPRMACDVILVDPDRLFREALSDILVRIGFAVVRTASLTKDLEPGDLWSADGRPRLFIIDMTEAVQELRERLPRLAPTPGTKLVALSRTMSNDKLHLALELGFHACLTKDVSFESFEKYMHLVLSGESIFPVGLAQTLLNEPGRDGAPKTDGGSNTLTDREYKVLGYLTQGASNKLIARHIGVSDATVKVNVKTLFRKIDVSNRTQAAAWATHKGIRPDDENVELSLPPTPDCRGL